MRKWTALLLGAAFVCGSFAPAVQAAERGGKMIFARYDDSTVIDPVYADRNPDIWLVTSLYETLLRNDRDGKIVPALAENYTVSPDGKAIVLNLRAGLKFSDGTPLSGEDVMFSLDRARDSNLGPWAGLLGSVDAVSTDGNTITISLKNPDPALLAVLASFNTAIVPKAAFSKAEGQSDQDKSRAFFLKGQTGSGPFIMAERSQGSRMVLKRNPNYWRAGEDGQALPYLDEVEFLIIPDDATRILKLQAGEVDGAEFIPFSRVAELNTQAQIKAELFPSSRIVYAPINTRIKRADGSDNPLHDKRVRQALNYATNKDILVQLITYGAGTPMTSLMAASTNLHYGPQPLYVYDLAKAKALLEEAGFSNGFEIKLTTLAGSAEDSTLFTALQQMWAPLGVKLVVEQVDNPTRGAKNRSGEFDLHTYGWANDINDPAQVTGWLGYYNIRQSVGTGWNNAEFNTLFEASNTEADPAKRKDQYEQMQKIYADEAPLLFLFETPFSTALSKSVEGYVQTPLGINDFTSAWKQK